MDWGPSQQRAFDLVKDELSKTPVLALYDPNRETTVSADASSYGLGALLRQMTNGTLRSVAYASRAMTPTEQRYSPARFTDYLYGMSFHVETDHKPLVSLLSSKKNLDELSPRIQRFRMRLMRYMYTIAHVPGKTLITADALSRAPRERPLTEAEELLTDEVTAQANLVVGSLPGTEKRLAEIRARQLEEGWPSHPSLPSVLRPYWQVQNELTIQNGLLLKGVRLVIPIMHAAGNAGQAARRTSGCCQVSIPGSVFRLVARAQSATGGVGAQLHGMRRRTTQSIRADDRI